jgi:hypothetical protein
MQIGQTVYVQKPDNQSKDGHHKERYRKYGYQKVL